MHYQLLAARGVAFGGAATLAHLAGLAFAAGHLVAAPAAVLAAAMLVKLGVYVRKEQA